LFVITFIFNQSGNGVGVGVNVGGDNNNVNANVGIATKRDNLSESPFLEDSHDIMLEYQVNGSNATLNVNDQFYSTVDASDDMYAYDDIYSDENDNVDFAYIDDGNQTYDVFESFYQDVIDSGQGNDVNIVYLEDETDF
jgi:hypothetical protein